jgi:TRAP-type uncharacterized transport system fused permease subunit
MPPHVAHLLSFYFAVLSEVSPPVGLSPSAAAAVTGGNPFGSMMQAWKYSLPAFLVPFLFSAHPIGANLLIVDATLGGFLLATLNSTVALAFLSLGIVGYLKSGLSYLERGALIVVAVSLVLDPIGLSIVDAVMLAIGVGIIAWNLRRSVAEGRGDGSRV